jgi:TPR repeat protein
MDLGDMEYRKGLVLSFKKKVQNIISVRILRSGYFENPPLLFFCYSRFSKKIKNKKIDGIMCELLLSEDFLKFMDTPKKLDHEFDLMPRIDAESPDEDLEILTERASSGDTLCLNLLGVMYYEGFIVQRDTHKAFDNFSKASELGHLLSSYNIGVMYYNGVDFTINKKMAFEWFSKAADMGCEDAKYAIGLSYLWGEGVEKDPHKAFDIFYKLAEGGYKEAINIFEEDKVASQAKMEKVVKEFQLVETEALEGNNESQTKLGSMYYFGTGVPRSTSKAMKWLGKAALSGWAEAQNNIAIMYMDGVGVLQDFKKAEWWLKKSAKGGYSGAMFNLGRLCMLSKMPKEAFKWFKKGALKDNPDAEHDLALMYLNGEGTKKNKDTAVKWLEKAVAQGHKKSIEVLNDLIYK